MFHANCLPILIGSLPLVDHQKAMQLILDSTPEIPLWPQLPKNPKEGMIRQFLTGFPGLIDQDNRYWIDTGVQDFGEEMAGFYEDYMQVEENPELLRSSRFALGMDSAAGFFTMQNLLAKEFSTHLTVKGQVTGPVTTGIGVKDQLGNSIFYDDNLRDILVKLLAMKARWQVSQLQKFTGKIPPLIFIDEPGLVSFGSSGFGGISREMVAETVAEVIAAIHREGGLAGVHICANGDWGPALSSAADILSFDAYFYFDNFILYKEQLVRLPEPRRNIGLGHCAYRRSTGGCPGVSRLTFSKMARAVENPGGLWLQRETADATDPHGPFLRYRLPDQGTCGKGSVNDGGTVKNG